MFKQAKQNRAFEGDVENNLSKIRTHPIDDLLRSFGEDGMANRGSL